MTSKNSTAAACSDDQGTLPVCGSLAYPYVAYQGTEARQYDSMEALSNGTLFPGLNLPFFRAVEASDVRENLHSQLMALDFVLTELGLYLDTHADDAEAFELFRKYKELACQARAAYIQKYGPLTQTDTACLDGYVWLNTPWPWERRKS